MIDIYEVNDKFLVSRKIVTSFFDKIIKLSDMQSLSSTTIIDIKEDNQSKRDFGWLTAFQIIKESHISVHTFVWIGFVSMDIYSCKKIKDVNLILQIVKNRLFNK